MEKKLNSRIQPSKCLRVLNLDQGAEIRAFTYMMGQHQQWLFNLYNFHLPYKEYMFFFLLELKILSLQSSFYLETELLFSRSVGLHVYLKSPSSTQPLCYP